MWILFKNTFLYFIGHYIDIFPSETVCVKVDYIFYILFQGRKGNIFYKKLLRKRMLGLMWQKPMTQRKDEALEMEWLAINQPSSE